MKFDIKNEPTDEGKIEDFEARKGLRLPVDYKTFLLEHNGGRPVEDSAFAEVEGWNWLVVEDLYGLTREAEHSIDGEWFNNFSDDIFARLLSVGYASASSLYMDLRDGPMHGKIYIMAHPANETVLIDDAGFEDDGDYEEARFLHPVANSWTEFVAMLGPEPPFDD